MEEHASRKMKMVNIGIAYSTWQKERVLRRLTNEKFALYLLSLLHQSTSSREQMKDVDFDDWPLKRNSRLCNSAQRTYSKRIPPSVVSLPQSSLLISSQREKPCAILPPSAACEFILPDVKDLPESPAASFDEPLALKAIKNEPLDVDFECTMTVGQNSESSYEHLSSLSEVPTVDPPFPTVDQPFPTESAQLTQGAEKPETETEQVSNLNSEMPEERKRRLAKERKKRWKERQNQKILDRVTVAKEWQMHKSIKELWLREERTSQIAEHRETISQRIEAAQVQKENRTLLIQKDRVSNLNSELPEERKRNDIFSNLNSEMPEERKRRLAKERKKRWKERQNQISLDRVKEANETVLNKSTKELWLHEEKTSQIAAHQETISQRIEAAQVEKENHTLLIEKERVSDLNSEMPEERKRRLANERKKRWRERQNQIILDRVKEAKEWQLHKNTKELRLHEERKSQIAVPQETITQRIVAAQVKKRNHKLLIEKERVANLNSEMPEVRKRRLANERKKRWRERQNQKILDRMREAKDWQLHKYNNDWRLHEERMSQMTVHQEASSQRIAVEQSQ